MTTRAWQPRVPEWTDLTPREQRQTQVLEDSLWHLIVHYVDQAHVLGCPPISAEVSAKCAQAAVNVLRTTPWQGDDA
jgi:hypothetical protein